MKKTLFPFVKRGFLAITSGTLVSTILLGNTGGSEIKYAENIIPPPNITFAPNMEWAKSKLTVNDDKVKIDLQEHFQITGSLSQLQADSSNNGVAAVEMSGQSLLLNVYSDGQLTIRIEAENSAGSTIIETFLIQVDRMGDGDGDGVITSADILFINQIISGRKTVSEEEKKKYDIDKDGAITRNDAIKLKDIFLAGPNYQPSFDEYYMKLEDINNAPIAHKAKVNGTSTVGEVLSGSYQYSDIESDPEGNSLFQWYRGTKADGSDKEQIAGATHQTYTLTEQDKDKYVFFEVTPLASQGAEHGKTVTSAASNLISAVQTIPLTLESLSPQDDQVEASHTDDFSITFNKNVTPTNKLIKIVKNGTIMAQYHANDSQYVLIDQNMVTIKNPGLSHNSQYSIQIETGAFTDTDGSEFTGFTNDSGWNFKTVNPVPNLFISEFLNGGNYETGIEVYLPDASGNWQPSNYKLEVHQFNPSNGTKSVVPLMLLKGGMNIIIDGRFYGLMDKTNVTYFNQEYYFDEVITALVLKDEAGNVIDLVGNPSGATDILPKGQTMVRKSGIKAGNKQYHTNEWETYSGSQLFKYIGGHTLE